MKTKEKLKKLLKGADTFEACYPIEELEKLGWDFSPDYENIAEVQGISFEEAMEYQREHYEYFIRIHADGSTDGCYQMHPYYGNEVGGTEETGDDEKTVEDIYYLEFIKK